MKIVITDFINIPIEAKNKLKSLTSIIIYEDTINDPRVTEERIKDAEIVTANYIDLSKYLIDSAPNLKYIISPAKGYDWIDSKAAKARGIQILNCPTFNAQAVAEHAIALMFAVKRQILNVNKSLINGDYNATSFVGSEVNGKTLLTIGHGEVGKRILKMAVGLGMKTLYSDSKTGLHDLDKMIAESDVVVLCLPLNHETKGMFDSERIKHLKRTAVVVNVARGLVIEQSTFLEILKENKLMGAGIDTFPKDETIKVPTKEILEFTKLPNVVATPHMAYNTFEAAERLGDELIADIESCLINKPINVVV